MDLSFIIPVYEPKEDDMLRCLNSVYSQGVDFSKFEVICVDDCSPSSRAKKLIEGFQYGGEHPKNLHYFRHEENKRQGGARNTGVKIAKGKYIQYLDQDDRLSKGALSKLVELIDSDDTIDIYMMDFVNIYIETNKIVGPFYQLNRTDKIKGSEFLLNCEIPWTPWCYCYRREFLLENNLTFAENVRFEDVDYVMKATMLANYIQFDPTIKIDRSLTPNQTTFIGSDLVRITDLIKMFYRVRLIGESYLETHPKCANLIIEHHRYANNSFIKRFYWRLKPKDFLNLIKTYPVKTPSKFKLLNIIMKYPRLFTYSATIFRPFLFGMRKMINLVKK